MTDPVRTTCPYCGVGCGVLATAGPDGSVTVAGDPDHPANRGRLCSKGAALGETMGLDGRLLAPRIGDREAGWDEAVDLVASRFAETVAKHGPDSVALYVSGQILTEDYYVANKLMKGFVGSANIDTNSRLCMASSVAGHRRAFGGDVVPGCYEDLEKADLVVLVGSNLAWCHPVLFQRLLAAREMRGTRIVVIDPRRSAAAEDADLHLPVCADGDTALFLGLLEHLRLSGAADPAWLAAHVSGAEDALELAHGYDPGSVAQATGLAAADVARFYSLWAGSERVVTVYSQGVNQSAVGTDKVNAIINCHLYTGRIGRPGMGPFSVTGQPNAMGGREVGGLANMLAAHMSLENAEDRDRVRRFWDSPVIAARPGLKAVDLFAAIAAGSVKAVWIMGTNPVVSLPDADAARRALAACPFVVVSDVEAVTDTTRHAHVLLPAAAWGEKSGTVTNSERRISRQRPFLPLPGAARPDWWIVCQVARRMGFAEAFAFDSPAAIFREHAALSGFENRGGRAFDIGAVAGLDDAAYDALAPFQWPSPAGRPEGTERLFGSGDFVTADRRARMVPVRAPHPAAAGGLVLNTGRIRDQWHTMTRTGRSARLMGQFGEPFCEIHPQDAAALGIAAASLVAIEARGSRAVLRALVTDRQRPGAVFVPMHWTGRFAGAGRVNALVAPLTDPVSGQPALKGAPVAASPFQARWFGFAVAASRPDPDCAYWALARADGGWRCELAGDSPVADWQHFAQALFGAKGDDVQWLAFHDLEHGLHRLAALRGDRLLGALFVSPEPVAVARTHVVARLSSPLRPQDRLRLLAGRPTEAGAEAGPQICACFGVGVSAIAAAVRAGACDVAAVGAALKAGTNCGSCRTDIRRIIDGERVQSAG